MAVAEAQDFYLARFEAQRERRTAEPAWLASIRRQGIERFVELGFPTTRDEEFRFTNLLPVAETPYAEAAAPSRPVTRATLAPFLVKQLTATLLVFVNGRFAPDLSHYAALPRNAQVGSLAAAIATDPGLVDPYFTRCATCDRLAFTALNAALTEDGAFVYIPAGALVQDPIHVFYFSTGDRPFVTHPRTVLVLGDGSQAKLIESYAGAAGERYLTNAVTEIVGGERSHLWHTRVQRESRAAAHVSNTHAYLERGAVFVQQNITFGGAIVRNDVTATLDASDIEATLDGLYLADGRRLVDNHTTIDHAKPHCASHQVYKGMLDGHARGVFNGKIFVRQDAQKTDAKQTNKVLLLSDDATINTKPQLEIYADDVKCTHGATVGQLDEEALFYLRARGIGRLEARAMLTHAFASDIIDRVPVVPVRDALEAALLMELPREARL